MLGFEAAAYRSADRGRIWSRIAGFNFLGRHRIAVDPVDPNQIYIATTSIAVAAGAADVKHEEESLLFRLTLNTACCWLLLSASW